MTTDLIVGLGGGGVVGTVLAAIVAGLFGRGKNRADAAKIITETAASLAAEVNKELQGVRAELATSRAETKREMAAIRTSVDHLTERVDEVLPLIEDDHPHMAVELRDANAAVKRVI